MFKTMKIIKYKSQAAVRLEAYMVHFHQNSPLVTPFDGIPLGKLANLIVGKAFDGLTPVYGQKLRPHFTSLALDGAVNGLYVAADKKDLEEFNAYFAIAGWLMSDMEANLSKYGLTELDEKVMVRCQKEGLELMQEHFPEIEEFGKMSAAFAAE
jgi:hypothetical protein